MGVPLEVSVLASSSVLHSCSCCQAVTQWYLYALGHVGLGPRELLCAQRWPLAYNKTPTGPSCKEGIYNVLKYSSSAARYGHNFYF